LNAYLCSNKATGQHKSIFQNTYPLEFRVPRVPRSAVAVRSSAASQTVWATSTYVLNSQEI
jgi:hypothetical protein